MAMDIYKFWAKTEPFQSVVTHGLISGNTAQVLFDKYISAGLRRRFCAITGLEEDQARAFIGYIVSLHDIGKIDYSFQIKDPVMQEKLNNCPELPHMLPLSNIRHEKTGMQSIRKIWMSKNENIDSVHLLSAVIGAHHQGKNGQGSVSRSTWYENQQAFEDLMRRTFLENTEHLPDFREDEEGIAGVMILSLLILADWISSGPEFADAEAWIEDPDAKERIRETAEAFLSESGMEPNHFDWPETFSGLWPNIPVGGMRPLQQETEALFTDQGKRYSVLLLEAPMGEGKTEAGVYAAVRMAAQWGKDGFYLALPTAATANQMVQRMREMLQMHDRGDTIRLLHAMAWLERADDFLGNTPDENDAIANWLTPVKRGLLGQYAVGTVDQAMLAATTVRYSVLRMLGLANKVLIIDEIHAYDAYMSSIIERLLSWCRALEIPVVMLSATLTGEKKRELFQPFTSACLSQEYPLITAIANDGSVTEKKVDHTNRKMKIKASLLPYLNNAEKIADAAVSAAENGGCICVLMNTVREAQEVYLAIRQRYDGDLLLFHAQFLAEDRTELEKECIRRYGKDKSKRPERSILVATQVVEQSLDVDFDAMITAAAPIDLIIQRTGRVHRHNDTVRPPALSTPSVQILIPEEGKTFGSSAYVYPECLLKSGIRVLRSYREFRIPEDIADMVRNGYDPATVPPEELQEWMENQIKDQVEAGSSQQYLVNPPDKMHNALIDTVLYDDDASSASAATRLGETTIRLALLEPELYDRLRPFLKTREDRTYAEVWNCDLAKQVMLHTVSVRISRLGGMESYFSDIIGAKLLAGTRICLLENGKCVLDSGKVIYYDQKLGVQIKGGEI